MKRRVPRSSPQGRQAGRETLARRMSVLPPHSGDRALHPLPPKSHHSPHTFFDVRRFDAHCGSFCCPFGNSAFSPSPLPSGFFVPTVSVAKTSVSPETAIGQALVGDSVCLIP